MSGSEIIVSIIKNTQKYTRLNENKTNKCPKIKCKCICSILVEHGEIAHITWWLSRWKLMNCIIQWYRKKNYIYFIWYIILWYDQVILEKFLQPIKYNMLFTAVEADITLENVNMTF